MAEYSLYNHYINSLQPFIVFFMIRKSYIRFCSLLSYLLFDFLHLVRSLLFDLVQLLQSRFHSVAHLRVARLKQFLAFSHSDFLDSWRTSFFLVCIEYLFLVVQLIVNVSIVSITTVRKMASCCFLYFVIMRFSCSSFCFLNSLMRRSSASFFSWIFFSITCDTV